MKKYEVLSENTIDADPFIQFDTWYRQHLQSGSPNPSSVSLGTASDNGTVSVRTVLLKEYSEDGFVFFTNYTSRKALHLNMNNNAALLFYWPESGRQVRIEGRTEKISPEASTRYYISRPRASRLSAWASKQSSVIPGREYLEECFSCYKKKFKGHPVERPSFWGGYRIMPSWFEFWQNGKDRLHDRICYSFREDTWVTERLAP
ncbi:MAG TPA: pyridoxamine 5'-phosphate oxidase [Bacteroidales bacterium]|nr:pyridoxamine 5'-phosphate oxidase [Bacteroidales bacterium]